MQPPNGLRLAGGYCVSAAIRGALSISLAARAAQVKGLLVPPENAKEAAIAGTLPVYPVSSLKEAVHFLEDESTVRKF